MKQLPPAESLAPPCWGPENLAAGPTSSTCCMGAARVGGWLQGQLGFSQPHQKKEEPLSWLFCKKSELRCRSAVPVVLSTSGQQSDELMESPLPKRDSSSGHEGLSRAHRMCGLDTAWNEPLLLLELRVIFYCICYPDQGSETAKFFVFRTVCDF